METKKLFLWFDSFFRFFVRLKNIRRLMYITTWIEWSIHSIRLAHFFYFLLLFMDIFVLNLFPSSLFDFSFLMKIKKKKLSCTIFALITLWGIYKISCTDEAERNEWINNHTIDQMKNDSVTRAFCRFSQWLSLTSLHASQFEPFRFGTTHSVEYLDWG